MKVLLSILVFLFAFNIGLSNITKSDTKQEIVKVKKSDVDYKTCDFSIDNVVVQHADTLRYSNNISTFRKQRDLYEKEYFCDITNNTILFNNAEEFT